jgi:hypothetical protein
VRSVNEICREFDRSRAAEALRLALAEKHSFERRKSAMSDHIEIPIAELEAERDLALHQRDIEHRNWIAASGVRDAERAAREKAEARIAELEAENGRLWDTIHAIAVKDLALPDPMVADEHAEPPQEWREGYLSDRVLQVRMALERITRAYTVWDIQCKKAQEWNAQNIGQKFGPMCPPPVELRQKVDAAIRDARAALTTAKPSTDPLDVVGRLGSAGYQTIDVSPYDVGAMRKNAPSARKERAK